MKCPILNYLKFYLHRKATEEISIKILLYSGIDQLQSHMTNQIGQYQRRVKLYGETSLQDLDLHGLFPQKAMLKNIYKFLYQSGGQYFKIHPLKLKFGEYSTSTLKHHYINTWRPCIDTIVEGKEFECLSEFHLKLFWLLSLIGNQAAPSVWGMILAAPTFFWNFTRRHWKT